MLSSESRVRPQAMEPQLSVSAGTAAAAAADDDALASAAKPPPQQAGSSALSMLTAALRASSTEPVDEEEPAAVEPLPAQQQHGEAPVAASAEAGPGWLPWDGPSVPSQDSRPLPPRALGSDGRSGDPVLLESFLSAGMHAASAEVRGAPMFALHCSCRRQVRCYQLCAS